MAKKMKKRHIIGLVSLLIGILLFIIMIVGPVNVRISSGKILNSKLILTDDGQYYQAKLKEFDKKHKNDYKKYLNAYYEKNQLNEKKIDALTDKTTYYRRDKKFLASDIKTSLLFGKSVEGAFLVKTVNTYNVTFSATFVMLLISLIFTCIGLVLLLFRIKNKKSKE